MGYKQSNYGDIHKIESAMGNRVFKSSVGTDNFNKKHRHMFFIKMTQARKAVHVSESVNTIVKVQRVDGC